MAGLSFSAECTCFLLCLQRLLILASLNLLSFRRSQEKTPFILIESKQVEDIVNVALALLFDKLQGLGLVDLNHLQLFLSPQVSDNYKLVGGELQRHQEFLSVDEFDLYQLKFFRVSQGHPLDIIHIVGSVLSFLFAGDLIDDWIAGDIFDDCFGLLPLFFEPVELVVGFPFLKSFEHFGVFDFDGLKLSSSYGRVEAAIGHLVFGGSSPFVHDVGDLIEKQPILSFYFCALSLILHLFFLRVEGDVVISVARHAGTWSNAQYVVEVSLLKFFLFYLFENFVGEWMTFVHLILILLEFTLSCNHPIKQSRRKGGILGWQFFDIVFQGGLSEINL